MPQELVHLLWVWPILAEHIDRMDMDIDDVDFHVEFEIGENIDVPEMSTQG